MLNLLQRILVTGLKVPIQQKVARNLLKYYYQKLTEIFQKNGRKLPFSFQYVQVYYKYIYIYVAVTDFV